MKPVWNRISKLPYLAASRGEIIPKQMRVSKSADLRSFDLHRRAARARELFSSTKKRRKITRMENSLSSVAREVSCAAFRDTSRAHLTGNHAAPSRRIRSQLTDELLMKPNVQSVRFFFLSFLSCSKGIRAKIASGNCRAYHHHSVTP